MRNTLVVNLFAGPGTGKSTGATHIVSQLKMRGIDAEYVSEFAKDKVWEHNNKVFENQLYLAGKQSFKISRCYGEVDVIITDSPILQSAVYCSEAEKNLAAAIIDEANKYNNLNFFLERVKAYNPNGRNQTEEEARQLDANIYKFLVYNNQRLDKVTGDIDGYNKIIDLIIKELN